MDMAHTLSVGRYMRGHVSLRENSDRGPRAVNQGFRMVRARPGTWPIATRVSEPIPITIFARSEYACSFVRRIDIAYRRNVNQLVRSQMRSFPV